MSRRTPTLQRLERLLTMVPWLLEHEGATVEEVAGRFGADPEEVLADLDTLGYCGLPGYGGGDLVEVSIVGDHIVVRMAEFFRRPLSLSVREAVTLLLAARTLGDVPDAPGSEALRSAAAKLEDALGRGAPGGAGGAVSGGVGGTHLAIDLAAPGDEHLPVLRSAIAADRVVRLRHRSGTTGETSVRDVEPSAVVAAHGAWYLQGWCRSARGTRHFRLDRIEHLTELDETSRRPPRRPEPPRYSPGPGDHEVVLELDPPAWWVGEWVVADRVHDEGPVRRVELRTPAFEWLARLLLRVAPHGRVVAPPELHERVRRLARESLARYRGGA